MHLNGGVVAGQSRSEEKEGALLSDLQELARAVKVAPDLLRNALGIGDCPKKGH